MGRVQDKIIVVTGAASGLGEADARLLVDEGARVIMTDINVSAGEKIAAEIGARFVKQDVSSEADWQNLSEIIQSEYGRLDGLVNNAGIAVIADIESTTTQEWRKTQSIHLDGTFWGCQMAIKFMKSCGGGSIVNMSSTAALVGIGSYLAYSAAKGGIRSMTKAIAIHCKQKQYGIRCNSVHPGSISTPMVHQALKELVGVDINQQEDTEKTRLEMGIGEPLDVAYMVLYLLSEESKHVTGAEMVVDNGDTVV